MAHGVFGCRVDFGEGSSQLRKLENGIVAESVAPAGGRRNASLTDPREDVRFSFGERQPDEATDETGRPLFGFGVGGKELEETGNVGLVTGPDACKIRRMNSGTSSEGVDLETGVISEYGEVSDRLCSVMGLDEGVGQKTVAGLGGSNNAVVGLGEWSVTAGGENTSDFADLAPIRRGQEERPETHGETSTRRWASRSTRIPPAALSNSASSSLR